MMMLSAVSPQATVLSLYLYYGNDRKQTRSQSSENQGCVQPLRKLPKKIIPIIYESKLLKQTHQDVCNSAAS